MEKAKKLSLIYLFLYFIVSFLGFYTKNIFIEETLSKLEFIMFALLGFFVCYSDIKPAKSLFSLLVIYNIFILFTDFKIYINPVYVFCENLSFVLLGSRLILREYNIKSDKINRKNICFVFRKPKKLNEYLKSIAGSYTSSFGMIIDNNIFQLRKRFGSIQCNRYKESYIYNNYIVYDTGISINTLTKEDIKKLLSNKARRLKTLFFRINCLVCFKDVLNKIGLGYGWRFLPCLFMKVVINDR